MTRLDMIKERWERSFNKLDPEETSVGHAQVDIEFLLSEIARKDEALIWIKHFHEQAGSTGHMTYLKALEALSPKEEKV